MTLRILALGATGTIGTNVIDLALARGHCVTAFVRSPHKIQRNDAGLSVIEGSALSMQDLARAMPGHDAVLSSIGPPPAEALRPSRLMAESIASTVAAMTSARMKRLLLVSAAVLFPERGLRFRFFRWLLRHHARDLAAMEAVVRATDLDWTIARPPRLVKASDESYRSRQGALPENGWSMSYRAVAAFLLDSVEQGTHCREIVGLASGGAT
jgi:putative NADH-flavin reductase